ncbi:hypothetical protein Patl1_26172 [Pistacia atlantica]|uniref:Uncharacterized protein n=1 Tax=Pistacia atlantica TaxID=434234 RepID=A0ACC1AZZ9_9ROSI|nr:hypothetical protein Patl1_26172 [Pistacia atlantica]
MGVSWAAFLALHGLFLFYLIICSTGVEEVGTSDVRAAKDLLDFGYGYLDVRSSFATSVTIVPVTMEIGMTVYGMGFVNASNSFCHFVQGGADEGEDLRNAAIRELREESGVTSTEFLAETPYWLTYDFPLKVKDRLNRCWGTNYKGQAQKW